MADEKTEAPRPAHNPFDPPAQKGLGKGFTTAIAVVVGLHALLGVYLWKYRFEPKYREYTDEKIDTELIKPPPLPVPPVTKRVESPAPPVIAPPAPPAPPRPSIITNPDWLRKPGGEDVARYYPDRAQRLERSGRATITCQVRANGTVTNCRIVSEDPPDMGFGDAAVRLSRLFKMRPQTRDGSPVEGASVTIPIAFRLPE